MIPMSMHRLMEAYCRLTGKFAMLIKLPDYDVVAPENYYDEVIHAAPYLQAIDDAFESNNDALGEILSDEGGVLIFDTEEEMNQFYRQTVGDDGPTELNKYDGPARVYALTCGPEGTRNENT